MFNRKQKGFTLIELLVVIAIIGLLAGIVLVSLGGARDSAKDARIQAGLGQSRALAEIISSQTAPPSYVPVCNGAGKFGADSRLQAIETDIAAQGATTTCYSAANTYCVQSSLISNAQRWCADSRGVSRQQAVGACTSSASSTCVLP
jgi:prepilin-type N-terminal cleavage/methylation domain-containing protein